MAPSAKPRTTSKTVATKPGCAPLKAAYDRAVKSAPKTWEEVEDGFLRGMEEFDANIAAGVADMGDLQNGKRDFFNKHNLDVTFPATGVVEFLLEAKAVGTPKHPGSPRQKPIGRAGSADLDKRIKEIGFKTIDLKAEYARIMAARGERPTAIAGDLTTWLRSVKPRSYVFIAARTNSNNDLARVLRLANVAGLVSDAVGVYCFSPVSVLQQTTYVARQVPPHIELARVLFRACQDLAALRTVSPIEPPSPSPAVLAEETPPADPQDPAH